MVAQPRILAASTSTAPSAAGTGGGDGTDARLAALEKQMDHVQDSIGLMRADIRDIRQRLDTDLKDLRGKIDKHFWASIGAAVFICSFIIAIYVKLGDKADAQSSKVTEALTSLQLSVQHVADTMPKQQPITALPKP